jgi:hypothetical protein
MRIGWLTDSPVAGWVMKKIAGLPLTRRQIALRAQSLSKKKGKRNNI